jgi:BirA family biotin operon repressor/biotin-[acetyl-CoA-carboxylase] ligase
MSVAKGQAEYVVVGIGVNVHNRRFPPELSDKATSIDLELQGKGKGSCQELTQRIWQEFALLYEVFSMTGDLSVLMEEYNRYLVNRNQQVRVLDPLGPWEGVARGINATGALLVETKDDLWCVDSGEVSVRGIYGYV